MACHAGNVEATAVAQRLLQAASQPYFSMLELWLCQGLLNDPYAEFMVEEDKASLPLLPQSCWDPCSLQVSYKAAS